ncbi:unnamed protein product, partial [Cryptosporidium hominis]
VSFFRIQVYQKKKFRKSPNTWLMDLFKLLDEQNDRARGEAFTLSSLHRAISKRLLIGRDLSIDDIVIINRKL